MGVDVPQDPVRTFTTVVPFMGVDWEVSISQQNELEREEQESDEQAYDLSFAYRIQWEHPEEDLKQAVKMLLCARSQPPTPPPVAPEEAMSLAETAKIRWLLVSNPNTPPPVLDSLVGDCPCVLLERIAEHPRTRPATLSRLAFEPDPDVRAAVAENVHTPMETLQMLARDEHPDVRFRLAESYHVPMEILIELSDDDNPYVCHRAQRTLNRIQMREALVGHFHSAWSGSRESRGRGDSSSISGFAL